MTATYVEANVLFSSKPFVYVLSSKERTTRCDNCFRKCEKLLRCSACKLARYCNTSCQKAAWQYHKDECSCLKRVAPQIPTDSVRLIYRLLLKLQKLNGLSEKEEVFGEIRTFDKLMSHSDEIKQDLKRMEEFVHLSQTLIVFSGDTLDLPSSEKLLDIFGKMVINSFSICDAEMRPIGVGLYLGASVLDHSCCPNVMVLFDGTTATVRCIKSFSMDKQGCLMARTSYIDLMQTTEERRLALKTQYYFSCDCERCADVDRDQLMMATCCPNSHCSGPVVDVNGKLSCLECHKDCSGDTYRNKRTLCLERIAENVKLIKQLQRAQTASPHKILQKCEKRLSNYLSFLHKLNVHCIQLKEMAFDSCIDVEDWKKALQYGEDLLIGYRQFYDRYNPLLGIHLMKLGKLSRYLDKLMDAKDYLLEAKCILLITHGRDNRICVDLADLLAELRVELEHHSQSGEQKSGKHSHSIQGSWLVCFI